MSAISEPPLGDARVKAWTCVNPEHRYVFWTGDVAHCRDCGLTSEHTTRWIRRIMVETLNGTAAEIEKTYPEQRYPKPSAVQTAAAEKAISDVLGDEVSLRSFTAEIFRQVAVHLRARAKEIR